MPVRYVVAVLVLFSSLGDAQEGDAKRSAPGENPADKQTSLVRHLDAVTWDPERSELTWLVSLWRVQGGERSLVTKERYAMHPDDAVMESGGEYRHFDSGEAKRLRILMDVISTYAVESTVWWAHGPDAKMDGQIIPLPDEDKKDNDDGKAEKDRGQKEKPAPKPTPSRVLVGPAAQLPEAAAAVPPPHR